VAVPWIAGQRGGNRFRRFADVGTCPIIDRREILAWDGEDRIGEAFAHLPLGPVPV
jgi:hypothetical protein